MDYSEDEEAEVVGVIFDPSDEVVVSYYLKRMAGDRDKCFPGLIHRLDIYESQPWNLLPAHEFKYGILKNEGFFFTPRHPCSSSSSSSTSSKSHVRRTVNGGFWHGKAHDKLIRQSGEVIGRKTSLHFKTTEGIPTNWIMQEYLLVDRCNTFQSVALCKIYKKPSSSSKSSDHLHLHEENNKIVEEAAAGPHAPSCKRQQPRRGLLQDHLQVEEAEPPCKKRRRQLLQRQDDHVDQEVDHGYSAELPPSSGDWNCASWDVLIGGQSAPFVPQGPGSDQAVTTTTTCSEEEIQMPAEAATVTTNWLPNEMFSLAQLLGEEEEEEVVVPTAAHDEMFSFAQFLENELLEEEEEEVPTAETLRGIPFSR